MQNPTTLPTPCQWIVPACLKLHVRLVLNIGSLLLLLLPSLVILPVCLVFLDLSDLPLQRVYEVEYLLPLLLAFILALVYQGLVGLYGLLQLLEEFGVLLCIHAKLVVIIVLLLVLEQEIIKALELGFFDLLVFVFFLQLIVVISVRAESCVDAFLNQREI